MLSSNKHKIYGITLRSGRTFGGAERRFARLFVYLANTGHDIHLFCTADALKGMKDLNIAIPEARVHICEKSLGSNWFLRKWRRIEGIITIFFKISQLKINHIHIAANPGPFTFIYSIFSRWLPSYSFSLVNSGNPENFKSPLWIWVLTKSLKNAACVDCLSKNITLSVLKLGIAHENQIKTSPCSFTDTSLTNISKMKDIDFLFLSRFTDGKGLEILSEALKIIQKRNSHKHYEIHVCGSGKLNVELPGAKVYFAKNSFEIMGRTKIFLSLQKYENYPSQSLLEAMASECAIISTDVGETRRLLTPECADLIPYDATILADAMLALISNEGKIKTMGLNAKKILEDKHSIHNFAQYFIQEVCN